MNKLGKVAVALAMAFSVGAAMTASAKEYVLKEGDDLEKTLVTARADWAASETDPKEPSVITLGEGTYTLTQEMYLDWPVTLVGETGDPDDVIVEGNKKFRICTINHADAEVKDLTIAKGHYANEAGVDGKPPYNWGNAGVRICAPGSTDRTATSWHSCSKGVGGKLTHCVVRDCETPYFHCWGTLYLYGPKEKTIVDRCVIRNNTHSGQENGQKGKGDIVTVESGILRNSLIKDNTTTQTHVATPGTPYQGIVTVCGANGEIVGCTIANNWQKNHSQHMVAGVLATAGKVVNTIIAGNKIDDPTAAQDRVWHGTASCFVNCVADWSEPINETCAATTDAGFVDAANGDYRLLTESPAVGFGSMTASEAMGDLDLAGNPRLRGDIVDAGAYAMTEGGETLARFTATPSGRGNEPMRVTFAAYTMGLGAPLKYLWDFDSDGTVDVATDENVLEYVFPMGKYSVTLTATNETSGAACSVTEADLLDVRIGSGTYEVDAKDGADAFQKKFDQIVAAEGSTAVRQEFVLKPGTYTITNEVMLAYPWTVRGSTGNPADVIIDVQNRNKAFCLNHASARLESLTVYRAKCTGVNSYGVVRICSPNGRGNQTNSTKGAGDGGLVSNVVLTACASTDKFTGQLLLVYSGAGVATHCVITNCTGWQQSDASAGGIFLQVGSGRADNCLVANNSFECKDVGGLKDENCSSSVRVAGGTLVNCTVANNRTSGLTTMLCAGVHVSGGKAVNTVIAANDSRSSRPHYSAWTGTAANFVNCLVEPDYELPNDTCVVGYPLFISPLNRDYRLSAASPCRNVGTNATTWTYGTTDLAGLPRQRDVGGEMTIDLGAYQYDETVVEPSRVHYVDANGTNPVSPYDTPETAATNVFDALKVTDWGHELRLLPGVHPVAKSVDITRDHITVCGTTGDPKDVVIRAVTSSNRCMKVNAGTHTLVHSLTLADGRGGSGGPAKGRNAVYGACLVVADVSQITSNGSGDDSLGSAHRGGTVSNCIVRGGLFTGKNCTSSGVFAYGPDALITHSVISNNVNGGFYTDNGCFGATGLVLGDGARGEHCLITGNRYYDNSNYGYYKAAAWVQGGSVLRYSTVYGNASTLVGGVNVSGSGRFEKCVIAGNTIGRSDTTDPRHAVWGAFDFAMGTTYYRKDLATHLADEEARHLGEAVQARVTTNASNVAEADLGPGSLTVETRLLFAHPKRGDFHPRPSSPTVDAVPPEAETAAMPQADLKGNRRLFGDGYDLGAVEGNYKGLMLLVK